MNIPADTQYDASTAKKEICEVRRRGNFICIAASDLVPEVNKHHGVRRNVIHLLSFVAGLSLMLLAALLI